jgi:hypothetical protein
LTQILLFFFLFCMAGRFPPPLTVDRPHPDSFVVKDANGLVMATVHGWDDLQEWSFGHSKLTSDEARKIAKAIARILRVQFMMQRRGFYSRGPGNCRFSSAPPFHVAFDATGEKSRRDGLWCVYEFGQQLDAMMA